MVFIFYLFTILASVFTGDIKIQQFTLVQINKSLMRKLLLYGVLNVN